MDKLPRFINENIVSSFYEPTFIEIERENIDLVILTSNGDFNEIWKNEVISELKLGLSIQGKSTISVIYAYNPEIKYYLIGITGQLLVVKKSENLEHFKTFNNVNCFKIQDYFNSGKPQLGIYFNSSDTPSIFDPRSFIIQTSDDIAPKLISAATLKITSQLQAMKVRLKNAEKLLLEKKALVSKMTVNSVYRGQDIFQDVQSDNLTCVLGVKSETVLQPRIEPIYVRNLGVRIVRNQWVIGFFISNLQEKPLTNFDLFINNVNNFVKKTVLLVPTETPHIPLNFEMEFKTVLFLEYGVQGYLLGIMDEPHFLEPSIKFKCSISFNFDKSEKKEQFYIGEVSIFYSEVISQLFVPFNISNEIQDLFSIIALSSITHLTVKFQSMLNEETFLESLLNCGFRKIRGNYFLSSSTNTVFRDCLLYIKLDENICRLKIFATHSQQLFLLIHHIRNSIFRGCQILVSENINFKSTCVVLKDELKCMKEILSRKIKNGCSEDSISFDFQELSLLTTKEYLTDSALRNMLIN